MPAVVTLSWFECFMAAQAGCMRRIEALKVGRTDRYGAVHNGCYWDVDVEGAAAEMAVSKHFNVYWEPVVRNPKTLEADVGNKYQVRHTGLPNGCLLIHPDDSGLFVLAVGLMPTFRIFGPVDAHLCKQDRWWREDTGRPAYFFPQSEFVEEGKVYEPETGDYWVYPSSWSSATRANWWRSENAPGGLDVSDPGA